MTPPPFPAASQPAKKKFGCLKVLGVLLLLFIALCFYATHDMGKQQEAKLRAQEAAQEEAEKRAEEARQRFPNEKTRILDELLRATDAADEKAVMSLAHEYRKVFDPEFRAALTRANTEIAKTLVQKKIAQAAQEKARNESLAAQKKAEEEKQAKDVPGTVIRLAKGVLGERYKDSSASPYEEGWNIWIRAKVGGHAEHPALLQREMIELASLCHPQGMKVVKFVLIYDSEFSDGLGNQSEGKLVQCQMIDGVADKINWGDREEDLFALKFDRVFSTTFCHHSYKKEWSASLLK